MPELFFKPQVTFEKVAAEVTLPDDPNMWPNEILQELYKQVPYIADFEPHVMMDTVDGEKGYALGHVEVTSRTEMQHGTSDESLQSAGVQTARIPIVVKDKKLQPLDLLVTKNSKMLPLTESRMRQAVFRPQAFDITARTPGDQSMIGQLYPPYRQNYGFGGGGGVAMGAGMGKMGSWFGSSKADAKAEVAAKANAYNHYANHMNAVIKARGGSLAPEDHDSHTKAYNETYNTNFPLLADWNPPEKKAELLLPAILPTINEGDYSTFCSKLASDKGLQLAYAANPHAKSSIFTLGRYEEGMLNKMATGLHASLTPSVVQVCTAPGCGYLVKSASHQMWAPEEEILDRRNAMRLLGEKVVLAADLNGGVTMSLGADSVEAKDPEADRAEVVEQFGIYKVQDEEGRHLVGYVFPNLLDMDGTSLPMALFTNGSHKAVQGEIVGINVGGGASLFEGPPRGHGAFYEVLPNGRAQATVPFTIKATLQGPDPGEGVTFVTEKYDGAQVQVRIQPNISKIQLVDGVMLVPDSYCWLPLDKAEEVALASTPDSFQKEARVNPYTHVDVRCDGALFSVDGIPVQKLAAEDKSFLAMDDALFLLAGLGADTDYALKKMGEAAAFHRPERVLVGREITLASEALENAREKAASRIAPNLRKDLVKEAAVIPDPTAVDTILSLGFINSENLATFVNYLPSLDEGQSKMCELLLAARLGVRELPVAALERAIRTTEEVLQGLRVLAFQQN